MLAEVAVNTNSDGKVKGISTQNRLHDGILIASLPELGVGGSWSTCQLGCNVEPPSDVAHIQFQSRIAFKIVWIPPAFGAFVVVDDAGVGLNVGRPNAEGLPSLGERKRNYQAVKGSKYAKYAEEVASTEL
jgi:hypothetical protein